MTKPIPIRTEPPIVEDTLWRALAAAQSMIGSIVRDAEGQARGGKYRYAALDTVIDAVRPALNAAGLVLLQPTRIDGDTLIVETQLIHAGTGEAVSCAYPAGPVSQQHQQLGSGVTYARRYSLMALLAVAPEDDDGATAGAAAGSRKPPHVATREPAATAHSMPNLKRAIEACASIAELDEWGAWYKAEAKPHLTHDQAVMIEAHGRVKRAALKTADDVFPGDRP